MISGFHTGDLNPIWTVPMLGTHKTVVATADNVFRSLRSGRPISAVPHFGVRRLAAILHMRLTGPHQYRLIIQPGGRTYQHDPASGHVHFVAPVTGRAPKLYLVSSGAEPIYVGQTVQSIRARMRLGFAADGRGGYYGYAWRHQYFAVDLQIWLLEDAPEETELIDLQTIEAELVYLLRHRLGQWPSYQTEIHFYASQPIHRQLAEQVYSHYYPDSKHNEQPTVA